MNEFKLGVRAGADLSGLQYLAMQVAGTVATSEINAFGVLANKPQSGEDASLVYMGKTRIKAGGALTAGALLSITTSGYFTAASSGPAVGRCINAVASGGVTDAVVNFTNLNITGG